MFGNKRKILAIVTSALVVCQIVIARPSNNNIDKTIGIETINVLNQMFDCRSTEDQISSWRSYMVAQPSNAEQELIFSQLPKAWLTKRITDTKALEDLQKRIAPALKIYQKSYKLVLVDYNKPVLIIDTDSVLIVTSEVLKIANAEELFGLIVHEEAHSIFRERTQALKGLLHSDKKNEAIKALALIELMCDNIAAYTLRATAQDPLAFLRLISRAEEIYPADTIENNFHPSGRKRLDVITTVLQQQTAKK